MNKRGLGTALLVLLLVSVARDASADEYDGTGLMLALAAIPVDLGLAMVDAGAAVAGHQLSRAYGAVETVVAGAQFAVCLDLRLSARPGNDATTMLTVGAALGGILMTHGLVTLLAPRRSQAEPAPSPAPVVITPVALSDIARASVPGMAVLGRF